MPKSYGLQIALSSLAAIFFATSFTIRKVSNLDALLKNWIVAIAYLIVPLYFLFYSQFQHEGYRNQNARTKRDKYIITLIYLIAGILEFLGSYFMLLTIA